MRRHTLILVAAVMLVPCGGATSAWGQQTRTVELDGIEFIPADIVVDVGDTVRWVWVSGFHNVESGVVVDLVGIHDGLFRSGEPTIQAGHAFDVQFSRAMVEANPRLDNVYPYYCVIHAFLAMTGTITVIEQGDLDRNGQIDLDDYAILQECITGPGNTATPDACSLKQLDPADTDGDGDVDLNDLATFQRAFSG